MVVKFNVARSTAGGKEGEMNVLIAGTCSVWSIVACLIESSFLQFYPKEIDAHPNYPYARYL